MNCHDYQPLIEEFFDAELDERTSLMVRRHLDTCPECAAQLNQLTAESEIYSKYCSRFDVRVELWPGVKARLAKARTTSSQTPEDSSWWRPLFTRPSVSLWAVAVLLIATIGLTVVFMRYVVGSKQQFAPPAAQQNIPEILSPPSDKLATVARDGVSLDQTDKLTKTTPRTGHTAHTPSGKVIQPVRSTQGRSRMKAPEQLVREAEQKYLAAIAMLSRSVASKRSRLDGATLAKLDTALASIDRTIASTRRAVREHPQDPVAVQYMLTAYAKKVDVLRQLGGQ